MYNNSNMNKTQLNYQLTLFLRTVFLRNEQERMISY